jgi:hypothetical protein
MFQVSIAGNKDIKRDLDNQIDSNQPAFLRVFIFLAFFFLFIIFLKIYTIETY